MIACANPHAQYAAHKAEIDAAVRRVLKSGWYILGGELRGFEEEFARYIGVSHAIGVGNGTEAIHLALAACGIGPGDEVITVSHTAVATVAAIELAGATPVLVDVEADFYTMDPLLLEQAVTPRTRAVIPVHLYGQPADLKTILKVAARHGLRVIEDCAQAHGAMYHGKRVGAWGDAACFSFYPTKNLGAIGDGGMVVSDNAKIAEKVRLLREYGWKERYVSSLRGWNSRLDEMQAAILRVKLRHLDADNARRAELAAVYDKGLAGSGAVLPRRRKDSRHVFHLYVVRCSERDRLQAFLKQKEVGTAVHYPMPIHLQPAYRKRLCCGSMKRTEQIAREALSLPLYPELSPLDVAKVTAMSRKFLVPGNPL